MITLKSKEIEQPIFVVKGLKANLLGLPTVTALNQVVRANIDTVVNHNTGVMSQEFVLKQFPPVFKGLGNLGEEYTIKLKPGAQP
jgi:hypothetical protein